MATSVFMKADEVQELLGVSRSEAYRIMKKIFLRFFGFRLTFTPLKFGISEGVIPTKEQPLRCSLKTEYQINRYFPV